MTAVTLSERGGIKRLYKRNLLPVRRRKVGEARDAGLLRKVEERYSGYDVQDLDGDKVGSVDAAYVNEDNQQEYIAVSGGVSSLLPGTSGSYIIPVDICTVDNNQGVIQVNAQKDAVKNSPSLQGGSDPTPEYAAQVRSYYGL
jgi:hypothetical protein